MDQVPGPPADRRSARARRRTPLRTALWVFGAGAAVALIVLSASAVVLTPLASAQHRDARARSDLAVERQCDAILATLERWQGFLETKLDAYTAGEKYSPADIASGSQLVQTLTDDTARLSAALRARALRDQASDLDAAAKGFSAAVADLSPIAAGTPLPARRYSSLVNSERAAFNHVWDVASTINNDMSDRTTAADIDVVADRITVARVLMACLGGLLTLAALGVGALLAVRAARQQRTRDEEAKRQRHASELHQAVDFSATEEAVYDVVGRALREWVPERYVELLIADSSHAHFHRVLGSHDDAELSGCAVASPNDCPAATRGHTMRFESSEAISACPYLRNRPTGPCSGVCIPVSIAGSSVGVMHTTGAESVLPSNADIETLESSTRRAAERIALLRAFDRSEAQATTDPLTGLLNRRSIENELHALQRDGTPYALAYGDLDHFKVLNDTHGHDAGDRALRLFARVLRDSVRPADLVSRYGGEEFLIVLPDCDVAHAIAVLERVRERLAVALAHGRSPAFTVSFGLATSDDGTTFDETAARADQALLAAKAAGRNRVLVAGEWVEPVDMIAPPR